MEEIKCPVCSTHVISVLPSVDGSFEHCSKNWTFIWQNTSHKVFEYSFDAFDPVKVSSNMTYTVEQRVAILTGWLVMINRLDGRLTALLGRRRGIEAELKVQIDMRDNSKYQLSKKHLAVDILHNKRGELDIWKVSLACHAQFTKQEPPGKNVTQMIVYAKRNGLPVLNWLIDSEWDI